MSCLVFRNLIILIIKLVKTATLDLEEMTLSKFSMPQLTLAQACKVLWVAAIFCRQQTYGNLQKSKNSFHQAFLSPTGHQ